jgi:hypothetical protein
MAYAQWAVFKIKAIGFTMTIKNCVHKCGKFYDGSNKDNEIPVSEIEGRTITPGNPYKFGACGRSDAAVGTEGSFDIYDGNTLVASYHWDCPWGSKTNYSNLDPHDEDDYVVQVIGANTDSGALGNIAITAVKI